MKDIARQAGVSVSTVSRILNGHANVRSDKKARVMELVRRYDYQPDHSARALVAQRSYLFGVIVPDLSTPFFVDVIAHVEQIAAKNGYNIILCNSEGYEQRELQAFSSLLARRVDGVLVAPVSDDSGVLDKLRRHAVKSVVITLTFSDLACVGVSHKTGGELVANHFVETGVHEFAFLGATDDDKFAGYRETLIHAGVPEGRIHLIKERQYWRVDPSQGYRDAREFLRTQSLSGRLGAFAVNDTFALGMMHAVKEAGLSVPKDVALVGFDNTFVCDVVSPALSSVEQPTESISRIAVEMLLHQIEDAGWEEADKAVMLEPRL
ncbi:MAG: LacI family transcriptional regulator, partial [Spirochaetales bacterium]|nr:LacI family transcriptional regulator [Spirochaetales bacterium]